MNGTSEIAVREALVITPADRAAAAAAARTAPGGDLDSWLIVMKDVALLAEHICDTSFVPKAYRGNAPAVAAAILAGRELGLPPMTALRHVQVVEGSPGLSAEYKRARVLAAGHKLDITEHTTEACTVTGHRKGHEPVTVRFTMADARKAGLVKDRGAYVTRPRRMLFARACTEVCDALFADLTNGLPTTELLEEEAELDGAAAAPVPTGAAQRVTAEHARARRPEPVQATAERAAAATPAEAAAPVPATASRGQVGVIQAHLERLGMGGDDQRDGRLRAVARILRTRELSSSTELTGDQASEVIRVLEGLREPAHLAALLDDIAIEMDGDPRDELARELPGDGE